MASNKKDRVFTTSTLFICIIFLQLLAFCQSCDSGSCLEHGATCNATDICAANLTCTNYTSESLNHCLCNQSDYFVSNNSCVSVDTLKVSAVKVAVQGTNFITLSWTANNPYNKNVSYYMNTSNQSVLANATGGTIQNLLSGQSYKIKIVSSLSETYYPTMTTFEQYDNAKTMARYNESCSSTTICETGTQCLNSFCLCKDTEYRLNNLCHPKKNHGDECNRTEECFTQFECKSYQNSNKHCLCANNNYHTSSNNSCTSATQLQVKNPSVQRRTTSSMYITWSVNTGIPANVNYKIQAGSITSLTANSSGGNITGLSPGLQYTLWIISTLPAESYYPELNTNVSITYWTSNTYAGSCSDSTSDCVPGTTCLKPFNSSNTKSLCLCDSSNSYATDDHTCLSLSNLQVGDVTWTTETHSINFNWSTKHILRANATYAIINSTNSNTLVNTSSGATVASLTNLVPGTKYSLRIRSELPSDSYYNSLSFTGDVLDIVTFPAKPGKVYNVTQLSNTTTNGPYEYIIYFGASEGNVANYTFVIKYNGSVVDTLINSTPSVVSNKLTPARIYSYEITAKNTAGNVSEITTDTFSTSASPSDEPSNLQIPADNITADTAIVTWKMPNNPNGNITGYVLYVTYSNQSCLQVYYVGCMDCSVQNLATDKCQQFEITRKNYTQNDLNSHSSTISMEISKLDPYTNYTVVVLPYNDAGQGKQASQSFTTKVARASNLISVSLNATRNADKVGLDVTWIPGRFTGPTHYTIQLEQKISLSSNSYTINDTKEVVGYDKNFFYFPDLLGHWDYKVTVTANTSEGPSSPKVEGTKTLTKTPGLATFSITVDSVIATKVTISINCPKEKERNGIIMKYTVKKILLKPNINEPDNKLNQNISRISENENPCEVTQGLLTDITVERNYSVEVMTINQDYPGIFSEGFNFFVPAKLPIIPLGTDVVKLSNSKESTLDVTVCKDCVANDTQGKIQDLWLAVCAETAPCFSSKRKRAVDEVFNSTWSAAKASGFKIGYRTTPLDWLNQLRAFSNSEVPFTVGNNTKCNSGETGVICNGPLPSATKFKVFVFVCNNAGCTRESSSVLATQVEDSPDTAAIIGGVIGGFAILAILIAVIVIAVLYFRKRPKPSSHHPLWDIDTKKIKENRPIRIREFREEVRKLHKDSNLLFQGEFEDIKNLSARFPHTSDEAKREGNRVKNRYVDILPYDHTRVKLDIQPEDDDTMDFINANYIPGYTSVREYIATQGPMHCTIPDFWRMTWEQKCPVIVMLSDLQEQGKRKVDLYWPENLNEPINYGNIIVEMTNFSQLNKYIIRNFTISKGPDTRKVTHFFLPGWWDFSANLTTGDVLEFAKLVRQMTTPAQTGPIIVHCSAGVGRTGTFIALDYFMQFIEKHSLDESIDVFSYVMRMRNNRPRMVQAETQYIFIFDALDEIIAKKIKEEEERENEGTYQNVKVNEENVYANTKTAYDNEAFEPEYQNMSFGGQQNGSYTPSQNGSHQPTTSL
ncbi:receptor-type tyrosine-protein phosphatase eta-like [Physella acuta]|uniref:receptor-type tyrosine-protein phosphatase eta-like n=1 Tax=Physella acuta TaxID=109671 RepID=UPI0027DB709E|nr:receptor-type tyrosine-protein phosphatase eta-like [Physella acuta]